MKPPENPTEIICEFEPASEHPEYSIARAAIDSSEQHYNKLSSQTYAVLKGRLVLKLTKRDVVLYSGMSHVVPANTVHSAEAEGAIIEVTSHPGWTPEDRIYV